MIAIHGVATLVAKTSTAVESNWVSLTITEPNGETSTEVTLYFATRNRGFEEEHRFALALAAAINSVTPMNVGHWGSEVELEPAVEVGSEVGGEVDLSAIRETEAPEDEEIISITWNHQR